VVLDDRLLACTKPAALRCRRLIHVVEISFFKWYVMANLQSSPAHWDEAPVSDSSCQTHSPEPEANRARRIVYIVDDDLGICEACRALFESAGFQARTFLSGEAFLASDMPTVPSCLLLDVQLRGLSGFAVQSQMREQGIGIPVIFVTGHEDVAMSVRAMKAGAFDFLVKPCREQMLIDAVNAALDSDERRIRAERPLRKLAPSYESLSACQREVMNLLVQGLSTREIASRLDLRINTVKLRRRELMKKMGTPTLVQLIVKFARLTRLRTSPSR